MLARTALLALAVLAVPTSDSPRFAPEPGSATEKHFRADGEYTVEMIEQTINGRHVELPIPAMEGSRSWHLAVIDRYVETRDGRPERLERRIDEIEGGCEFELEVLGESGRYGVSMTSDLVGADLLVRFDPDEEEVRIEVPEDSDLDESLLEGLREDLDLRALLPEGEVAEGDRWEVPAERLVDVLQPGGDLTLQPEDLVCTNPMLMEPVDVLAVSLVGSAAGLEEAEGDVTLTWRETRGKEAYVSVEFDLACEADFTDAILALAERGGLDTGRDDYHASVERELSGEGTLVWSLDEDRFRSLELQVEETDVVTLGYSVGGIALDFHVEMSVTSTIEHSAD